MAILAMSVATLITAGIAMARPGNGHARQVVANGVVQGTTAPADPATGSTTFTVHRANGQDVQCTLTAETRFLKADGGAGSASDVADGAKVQVKGTKDSSTGVLSAVRVLIKKPAPAPEPAPAP
ncbi:MAG TPA: hypothetical protein VFU47_07755 [Armatimonadota bacterium]|nr:hypothetical protein [Armatimonadota bacterium]